MVGRGRVGGVEDLASGGVGLLGGAVLDVAGIIRRIPQRQCSWFYQPKQSQQNA